jgi:HAE1 family hydrophobic/amphiphilic exporter-1
MKLIEFSLKRRVTISMLAIAVTLFGIVAFTRLPINLLPDISYPTLTVETRFAGAAPTEIEALITRPIEEAVGVVAGVQRLTSVSKPGLSQVTLEFGWGRNMDFAALDVRQKLDLVTLPREAPKPLVLRFDPSNDPIARIFLKGTDDLFQLRYLAEEVLKKDLESTDGLAAIKVNGGYEEEIQVQIDEGQLSLMGLSIGEVRDRLARENINQAGGSLYEREARYLVRSRNEFESLADIEKTVLRQENGRLVTLADVATVRRTHKQREVVTRFGGKEAVEMALYKEGDANTVQVSRAIHSRLELIKKELPPGIELEVGTDQSTFIQASIDEVLANGWQGGLIAIVVLLLFLKDTRSTLVVGISIPLSIIATFFLMYQTGTTLNVMSLGGLALGVGMLVDNAIVVVEAIYQRRERGEGALEAVLKGASSVAEAVIASTLTTVAVFLPVVFLEGIAAQLFRDQAVTVSFSLIASLVVSLTLIPMFTAIITTPATSVLAGAATMPSQPSRLRRVVHFLLFVVPISIVRAVRYLLGGLFDLLAILGRPLGTAFDAGMGRITDLYPKVLRGALGRPWLVVGLSAAFLAAAGALVPMLGVDLIPSLSQGEFSFRVELPEGTPLDATDRFIAEAQEILVGDARIASFSSIAGGAGLSLANTGTEGENVARIQVRMVKSASAADEEAVAEALRARLSLAKEADFKFERPSVFTFRTPVEVEVYGDELGDLHKGSAALTERLASVPGLVDLKSSAELGNPELQITFQRDQLVKLGLDLAQVAAVVRGKVQGDVATRFTDNDREIDILVRSVERGQASVEEVADLIVGQRKAGGTRQIQERTESGFYLAREVAAGPGETVPIRLKTIADVKLTEGPSEIRRIGQKRAAVISANLQGRDMGAVAADVREILRSTALPPSATAMLGGQQEEMARSMRSLILAMALAIFLVYLVMAAQFESFLHPLVIMFSVPLAAIGVIFALFVTGTTVNVVAMIGVVLLAGVVVNNAIVLIDGVNTLRRENGYPRMAALVEAGRSRLRPILMTTGTTVLGLLPMALGLGDGAELRAPLAITVIGGLSMATLLTLVVIPAIYLLMDRELLPADLAAQAAGEELDADALPYSANSEIHAAEA